ncbi:LmeA family phospholipid-binding protein [Allorhizocola rhizosphaerae]|uniref:LmeA family phospholipid-binding protein n=1 Tax=Allorhizocola rhizosphaerae TaxID=1872709 RepID=UPI0013C2DEC8|nr:DUF2993 domain-containing protein [Allorhizocola rhizosphaerae]
MRRLLNISAVVVLVLAVLLAVADRVGAHYAEQAIGERVSAQLASRQITSSPPEVTVKGYPFLTQVLRGNYTEIRVNLRDVKTGNLPIPQLDVRAYDVRASLDGILNGTEKVTATRVDGVGTLSYASLVEASGIRDLTMSGDGNVLRISGNVPVAGLLTGAARVTVIDGRVRIQVTELTAANANASTNAVLNQYKSRLGAATFSLPQMPFQLQLSSVTPATTGLEIGMTATEVPLN